MIIKIHTILKKTNRFFLRTMKEHFILKTLAVSLLISNTVSAQENDLTVAFRIKTKAESNEYPFIMTNKSWEKGEVKDFTTIHQLGKSRTTKIQKGWCIGLQENGSWFWNMGANADSPLDYHPTFERQPVSDGNWHHLGFSINSEKNEAWLYYDGKLRAVLSMQNVNNEKLSCFSDSLIRNFRNQKSNPLNGKAALKDVTILKEYLPEQAFKSRIIKSPINKTNQYKNSPVPDSLRVLAWNIWHGGRHDGITTGIERVVDIIRNTSANIILMVETYGSGSVIGDSLDYIYYRRGDNLSVFSPYKIVETHGLYDPFRFGGVTLDLGQENYLRVFSLWIYHLPSLRPLFKRAASVKEILDEENKTRGKEITKIMETIRVLTADADSIPIIIGGDFNSASHLDWGYGTKDSPHHYGYSIPWPESITMSIEGYIDAFRQIHPDPVSSPGLTWSPRFAESRQERIDYIYFKSEKLRCFSSRVLNRYDPRWPSDHAAVFSQFILEKH